MTEPAQTPKLSVLMISYNHEPFIAQALESVLAQKTNFDFEIVVGEDCSTDHTRRILLDYAARYPEKIVPILREKNIGSSANFEDTLLHCRGEYVAFLETDDYWTDDRKLQRQADFLDEHPECAICCHRAEIVYSANPGESGIFPTLPERAYSVRDFITENFLPSCSVVFRHKLNAILPDGLKDVFPSDWARWALLARDGSIYLLDRVMAAYRVHPGGIWSSAPRLKQLESTADLLQRLNEHFGLEYTAEVNRGLARIYLQMAQVSREKLQRWETAKHVMRSFRFGILKQPRLWRSIAAFIGYFVFGSLWVSAMNARRVSPR